MKRDRWRSRKDQRWKRSGADIDQSIEFIWTARNGDGGSAGCYGWLDLPTICHMLVPEMNWHGHRGNEDVHHITNDSADNNRIDKGSHENFFFGLILEKSFKKKEEYSKNGLIKRKKEGIKDKKLMLLSWNWWVWKWGKEWREGVDYIGGKREWERENNGSLAGLLQPTEHAEGNGKRRWTRV